MNLKAAHMFMAQRGHITCEWFVAAAQRGIRRPLCDYTAREYLYLWTACVSLSITGTKQKWACEERRMGEYQLKHKYENIYKIMLCTITTQTKHKQQIPKQ